MEFHIPLPALSVSSPII